MAMRSIYKMKDQELAAIANSDDPRADDAWQELCERQQDRRDNPHEDTPCLEEPWWAYP